MSDLASIENEVSYFIRRPSVGFVIVTDLRRSPRLCYLSNWMQRSCCRLLRGCWGYDGNWLEIEFLFHLNISIISFHPTVTAGAGIPAAIIACNAGLGMKVLLKSLCTNETPLSHFRSLHGCVRCSWFNPHTIMSCDLVRTTPATYFYVCRGIIILFW